LKGEFSVENQNYEEFYRDIQQKEKSIKDKLQQAQRNFKNIIRDSERGDIKKLIKDIEESRNIAAELTLLSENLQTAANSFDSQSYFESGEFTRQMITYCNQQGVDIKGEAGIYEMFPFRVRVDSENQDVYVNRRKIPCVRPLQFVKDMKQQVEKYTKSNFNVSQFVNELAAAYDLAVIVRNNNNPAPRHEFDVLLKDIYAYLAPTQKARREYDLQQYAFDLARLHSAGLEEYTKDGRRFEFGTSKQANKLIRILDSGGTEQFLGTIRFYK